VFAVALRSGETLDLTLVSTVDPESMTDLATDVFVYGASSADIYKSTPVAHVGGDGATKSLRFVAPVGGTYFVDVYAGMGRGSYALRWSATPRPRPSMVLTPSGKSRTVKRNAGRASFRVASRLSDPCGAPMVGHSAILQVSIDGRKWKTAYRTKTDSNGSAGRVVSARKAGTQYYRWYKPATPGSPAAFTAVQRIVVR
jgi:hypothetical protein